MAEDKERSPCPKNPSMLYTKKIKQRIMVYRNYAIAPIETGYGHYVFSSRLEARWAVYFDNLGVDYYYEDWWFELPSRKYKPDFWIEDEYSGKLLWLEIKPSYPTESEIKVMLELFEATGENGIILYGKIPKPSQHIEYNFAPGVGIIEFEGFWDEEIGDCVPGWLKKDGKFLTFNREFEEVDKALQDAITCYF